MSTPPSKVAGGEHFRVSDYVETLIPEDADVSVSVTYGLRRAEPAPGAAAAAAPTFQNDVYDVFADLLENYYEGALEQTPLDSRRIARSLKEWMAADFPAMSARAEEFRAVNRTIADFIEEHAQSCVAPFLCVMAERLQLQIVGIERERGTVLLGLCLPDAAARESLTRPLTSLGVFFAPFFRYRTLFFFYDDQTLTRASLHAANLDAPAAEAVWLSYLMGYRRGPMDTFRKNVALPIFAYCFGEEANHARALSTETFLRRTYGMRPFAQDALVKTWLNNSGANFAADALLKHLRSILRPAAVQPNLKSLIEKAARYELLPQSLVTAEALKQLIGDLARDGKQYAPAYVDALAEVVQSPAHLWRAFSDSELGWFLQAGRAHGLWEANRYLAPLFIFAFQTDLSLVPTSAAAAAAAAPAAATAPALLEHFRETYEAGQMNRFKEPSAYAVEVVFRMPAVPSTPPLGLDLARWDAALKMLTDTRTHIDALTRAFYETWYAGTTHLHGLLAQHQHRRAPTREEFQALFAADWVRALQRLNLRQLETDLRTLERTLAAAT